MKTVNLVIYNQFKQSDRNDRYPEIQDDPSKTAVVIEIKSCKSTDELLNAQKVALEQIKGKKYAESYIKDSSIDHVYAYAIAFSNKYCRVKVEALK